MNRHIIYNAQIINENKRLFGYVIIDDDKISAVQEGVPPTSLIESCNSSTDINNALLIPGAIDDQVHFREPGLTHKADIETESRAAVAGGVTSFMDMPNTIPQTTTIEALNHKFERANAVSLANYSFYIGATNDNVEILKTLDYSQVCGVKLFLGASTGNMLVDNKDTLTKIFSEVPALIAVHSEDEEIIRKNKERYSLRHGENLPIHFHPLIRSEEACYASTARTVELADKYNTQLHVLHLSTARELELFNNNISLADKRITAEVCVHHLWFSDNDYSKYGNRIKWNPAIKTVADCNALREAINNNKIDIVATDHAPHLLSEKIGSCLKATSGGPLVQFSLIAMLEMAKNGIFNIEKVVEKMCHAPATLYRIDRRGYIKPGYYADLVVINENVKNTILASDVISKCGWSPFEGTTFSHKISQCYINGNLTFDNGKFNDEHKGKKLQFIIQ